MMTKSMPWFRFYSEALNDMKIERACRMSNQSKVTVLGVWALLLCLANDSPQRGKLLISDELPITDEEIEIESGMDLISLGKILDAFTKTGMISRSSYYEIVNWNERQFDSDNSTARVRKHRRLKKQNETEDETFQKRSRNVIDTDTYTDKDTYVTHTHELPAAIQAIITELAKAVKTPYWAKTESEFEAAAYTLFGLDATPAQVAGFAGWWADNGHYPGAPALKSLLSEWRNYSNGVVMAAGNGNKAVKTPAPVAGEF